MFSMVEKYGIEEKATMTFIWACCIPCSYYQMIFEVTSSRQLLCVGRLWPGSASSEQVQDQEGGRFGMFGSWEPGA